MTLKVALAPSVRNAFVNHRLLLVEARNPDLPQQERSSSCCTVKAGVTSSGSLRIVNTTAPLGHLRDVCRGVCGEKGVL